MVIFLLLGLRLPAWAQDYQQEYYEPPGQAAELPPLTADEVEELVAPIALYPDPLIAQILPAATFVDQIDQAARYVRQYGSSARIEDQPWDVSVKSVAHYPDLLYMMDQKYDWTVSLGQAYLDQPQDLMDAIQRLRRDAQQEGNLYTTPEQQVAVTPDYITIVPANPDYLYLPVYDPMLVYIEPYQPGYPYITFGFGLVIGAWLSRDCDWRHHRVYYHGWHGGGWIARSRPHIQDRRGIYISRNAAVIHTNQRVLQHDTRAFHQELRGETTRRREQGTLPPRPGRAGQPRGQRPPASQQRSPQAGQPRQPGGEQRTPQAGQPRQPGGEQRTPQAGQPRQPSTGAATGRGERPAATAAPKPAPATAQKPAAEEQHGPVVRPERRSGRKPEAAPGSVDVFRGRDVQKVQPASQSGYGGYGTGKDATIYRQRGEESRQNMRQSSQPATAPAVRPAAQPAQRPAFSAPAATRAASPPPVRSAPSPAPAVRPAPAPAGHPGPAK